MPRRPRAGWRRPLGSSTVVTSNRFGRRLAIKLPTTRSSASTAKAPIDEHARRFREIALHHNASFPGRPWQVLSSLLEALSALFVDPFNAAEPLLRFFAVAR